METVERKYYFNTCIVHLLSFYTMTNKCTIISQIIYYYKLPEDDTIVLKHVGV